MSFTITNGFYKNSSTFWADRDPRKNYGKIFNYSITRELKKQGKINDEFELMLNNISLEDLIALKLEASSKIIGGKLFGLQLFHSIPDIAKDAVMRYAFSSARTKKEATRFLGLSWNALYRNLKRYSMGEFLNFKNLEKDDED